MATDNEQLVLSISADTRQIQRQLKSLIGQTQADTKAIEQAFTGAGATAASSFDGVAAKSARAFTSAKQGAERYQTAVKGSAIQTGNLAAQLNDIGVQLAGGQSPFLIAIQQGTQINQVLGGQGVRGVVAGLAGAFGSLINPIGLATIATIGLGGAAVQYFTEWLSSGKATTEEIAKQAALVQKVADKYGVAIPAIKEYADELTRAAEAAERLEAIKVTRESVSGDFAKRFTEVTEAILPIIQIVPDANREFGILASKIESNTQTADDFQRVISSLNKVFEETGQQSVKQVIQSLEGLQASSDAASGKMKDLDADAKVVQLTFQELKDLTAALTSQLLGLGTSGSGAIKEIAEAVSGFLGPAMRTVSGFVDGLAKDWEAVGKAQSSAADQIRKHEGFRETARYDVNAYRTGYGSDTTTRADGTIEKVTRETIVTLADAERDLSRRIVEFQSGIQNAIGLETWRSLSDAQQGALTSIAYNYGSLPKKIVEAIKKGGGPEVVAQAIASLSANPTRRKEEAQAYLSGSGYSLKDAGIGVTPKAPKKTPDQIFQGDVEQIQRRIDVLNAEYDAQGRVNPLINDYGFQVEQARIKQQLLNEAKKAGVEITPQLAAKVDELATNYASASASVDRLRESQERTAQVAQELASIEREAIGGLIGDLLRGEDASKALANALGKVADRLLDIGIDSLLDGLGGKGGTGILGTLFGGLFGGARAAGGPVASGKTYLVGEKGPELFSPGRSGTIIPNNRLPNINPRDLKVAGRGGRQGVDVRVAADVDGSGNLIPLITKVADERANTATARGQQQAQRTLPAMQADRQRRFS